MDIKILEKLIANRALELADELANYDLESFFAEWTGIAKTNKILCQNYIVKIEISKMENPQHDQNPN